MKKKIVTSGLLTLVMITQLAATDIMLDQSKLDEIKSMSKVLQDSVITIKGAIDKESVYLLKVEVKSPNGPQNITAFLDKKTDALYIGRGYEKDGKPILFPKETSIIKNGISFTHGTGKEELYVVTDPECPYCAKFEKAFGDKLDNYTIHTILFPLSFHRNSPAMVEWILQGKDDSEKYNRYKNILLNGSKEYQTLAKDANKTFQNSDKIKEHLMKANKATVELGAMGTPTIFDSKFKQISPTQLKITQAKATTTKTN